jgi:hypothetical protein
MKTIFAALVVVCAPVLSGCGKPDVSEPAFEPVESLVANPERLKELRAQCKADHAKVGAAQCNAVAEATRQRFMGSGTPYTPPASKPAPSEAAAP